MWSSRWRARTASNGLVLSGGDEWFRKCEGRDVPVGSLGGDTLDGLR